MSEERQLDLLKTRRQKGKLPPGPSEFEVHAALADVLRRWIKPDWVWLHVPNGGERTKRVSADGTKYSSEGARLARLGVVAGASDLLLFAPPNGRVHALEIKRPGETPREDQKNFALKVEAAGGIADWCDSVERGIAILKDWDCLRVTIKT